MGPIAKFLRLSSGEKWLSVEAALWLTLAEIAVPVLPFRWIASCLGRRMAESPRTATAVQTALAKRVSQAIGRASRHRPWNSPCLAQAIAGKMMLRRRGTPSTLYLGVAKDDKSRLAAHAWLRCGETVLTGAEGRGRFTVVASFAEEASQPAR